MSKKLVNGVVSDIHLRNKLSLNKTKQEYSEVIANEKAEADNLKNLKASAKAKLIAGEPLTEAEADTIVL